MIAVLLHSCCFHYMTFYFANFNTVTELLPSGAHLPRRTNFTWHSFHHSAPAVWKITSWNSTCKSFAVCLHVQAQTRLFDLTTLNLHCCRLCSKTSVSCCHHTKFLEPPPNISSVCLASLLLPPKTKG